MAQPNSDKTNGGQAHPTQKMSRKAQHTSGANDFDPLSITNGGDAGLFEDDEVLVDPVMEVDILLVSRGVDDGVAESMLQNSPGISNLNSNTHKMSDSIRSTKDKVANQLHHLSDTVKSQASNLSREVKAGVATAKVGINRGVVTADQKIKQNPYAFALGAVGVGFILGRIFMTRKNMKINVQEFQDNQAGLVDHTGVHVRQESRYAGT